MDSKDMNERFKASMRGLLRPRRLCSISRYLLLAELAEGEVSSLALTRRLLDAGLTNPRVLLREDDDGLVRRICREDGVFWGLTRRGRVVLQEAQRRMFGE